MKTLQDYQHLFDTDLENLLTMNEDSIEFLKQSHSGDLLIEKTEDNYERFILWRNLDCNGGGIEIEFAGKLNNYCYETIYNSNDIEY